ncbi:serine/threonine-protein kinase 33 isoform X1 [Tachysurus ichikawai]
MMMFQGDTSTNASPTNVLVMMRQFQNAPEDGESEEVSEGMGSLSLSCSQESVVESVASSESLSAPPSAPTSCAPAQTFSLIKDLKSNKKPSTSTKQKKKKSCTSSCDSVRKSDSAVKTSSAPGVCMVQSFKQMNTKHHNQQDKQESRNKTYAPKPLTLNDSPAHSSTGHSPNSRSKKIRSSAVLVAGEHSPCGYSGRTGTDDKGSFGVRRLITVQSQIHGHKMGSEGERRGQDYNLVPLSDPTVRDTAHGSTPRAIGQSDNAIRDE